MRLVRMKLIPGGRFKTVHFGVEGDVPLKKPNNGLPTQNSLGCHRNHCSLAASIFRNIATTTLCRVCT